MPSFFYWEGVSQSFLPGLTLDAIFPTSLSWKAGMIGAHHHALVLVEIGSCTTPCLAWPQTVTLPISASQLARIKGISHWYPAMLWFLEYLIGNCCIICHLQMTWNRKTTLTYIHLSSQLWYILVLKTRFSGSVVQQNNLNIMWISCLIVFSFIVEYKWN
jgi:hypothetical protein